MFTLFVLDSIEKNIETTQMTVKDANTQLAGAVKYQVIVVLFF